MATDVSLNQHQMRKTRTIYSIFFEPKNFRLSVYNLYLFNFDGKQFLFFCWMGQNIKKKIKEVFLWENNMEKSSLIFFLEVLPRSIKNKTFSH
jgi:hypothetical protein